MSANAEKPAYPTVDLANDGLTKRELIAAMAMQGILASVTADNKSDSNIVSGSVQIADALLAELEKGKK